MMDIVQRDWPVLATGNATAILYIRICGPKRDDEIENDWMRHAEPATCQIRTAGPSWSIAARGLSYISHLLLVVAADRQPARLVLL